jgi:hypothetical protein
METRAFGVNLAGKFGKSPKKSTLSRNTFARGMTMIESKAEHEINKPKQDQDRKSENKSIKKFGAKGQALHVQSDIYKRIVVDIGGIGKRVKNVSIF